MDLRRCAMPADVSGLYQINRNSLTRYSAVGEKGEEEGESKHAWPTLDIYLRPTYAPKYGQQLGAAANLLCIGTNWRSKARRCRDERVLAFRSRHTGIAQSGTIGLGIEPRLVDDTIIY